MNGELKYAVAEIEKHLNLHKGTLKLWKQLTRGKHLSAGTLDKLALLAGFQSWEDLNDAIHGDSDAQINYEDDVLTDKKK